MTEAEKRMHRVCFTGHRPEKLTRPDRAIKKDLEKEIRQAVADGLNVFITGMARGVDIWAAQIVLMLRDESYDVKLMCACPYDGFERGWSQEWQRQYKEILATADFVKYVCEDYSRACFQIRNEWMVNHAARVIAVFNGEKSGTKNTIDYAVKVGVPVVRIEGCSVSELAHSKKYPRKFTQELQVRSTSISRFKYLSISLRMLFRECKGKSGGVVVLR